MSINADDYTVDGRLRNSIFRQIKVDVSVITGKQFMDATVGADRATIISEGNNHITVTGS